MDARHCNGKLPNGVELQHGTWEELSDVAVAGKVNLICCLAKLENTESRNGKDIGGKQPLIKGGSGKKKKKVRVGMAGRCKVTAILGHKKRTLRIKN